MHRKSVVTTSSASLAFCLAAYVSTLLSACTHVSGPVAEYAALPNSKIEFVTEPVFASRMQILRAGSPDKPAVVLIHGMGDRGMSDWRYLVPELAANYYVLALDLPGFGASEAKNAEYDIDHYAEVIKWLVDTYSSGPLRIVGHSLGGAVALRYTAKYPQRVHSLVIADVAGILYRTTVTEYITQLDPNFKDPIAKLFKPLVKGVNILLRTITGGFGVARVQNRLYSILHDPDLRATYFRGSRIIAALGLVLSNFSADLDKIDKPTLIVWGDNDNVAPLRTGKLLEYKIKGSVLKTIHAAGHAPMLTQPELFNHLVLTAFASPPSRSEPLFPVARDSTNPEPAYCLYQEEPVTISGEYGVVVIDHCAQAVLRDVISEQVIIHNSTATLENVTTAGDPWGLVVHNSIVNVQRSRLTGSVIGLLAQESRINIEQSRISGQGYGMVLSDSVAELNGIESSGDKALQVTDSELHATGIDLTGNVFALGTTSPATLMFSVSHVRSAHFDNYLHGPIIFIPNEPL